MASTGLRPLDEDWVRTLGINFKKMDNLRGFGIVRADVGVGIRAYGDKD